MIREKGTHRYKVTVEFKVLTLYVVAKNQPQAKSKAVKNMAARNFSRLVDHQKTSVDRL